jgi:hypothetical protein
MRFSSVAICPLAKMDQHFKLCELQREALWTQFKDMVLTTDEWSLEKYHRLANVAKNLVKQELDNTGEILEMLYEKNGPPKRKRSKAKAKEELITID